MPPRFQFPIEDIPEATRLFRRILRRHVKTDNSPKPAAFNLFRKSVPGISCDWEKYSTPQQTLDRGKASTPEAIAGVVYFICRELRREDFRVTHTPVNYQAHCTVLGEDTTQNRVTLSRLCEHNWVLQVQG